MAGDDLHAVGRDGRAVAVAPGAQLRGDVVGAQAEQTWDCRLLAGEMRPMTIGAGGNLALGVALGDKRLAQRQHILGGLGHILRQWRVLAGEIVGNGMQIGVRHELQQIVHRRIFAAAVAEGDELIEQIAGRLARQPRKIIVIGALAVVAMARRAAEHARGDRIGWLSIVLCRRRHGWKNKRRNDGREPEAACHAMSPICRR